MSNHACFIVPPYLLQDIAEAGEDPEARRLAAATLAKTEYIHRARKRFFEVKIAHGPHSGHGPSGLSQDIVPDYVLEDLSKAEGVDEGVRRSAEDTLAVNRQLREQRVAGVADTGAAAAASTAPALANFTRSVYDMENREKKWPFGGIDNTPELLPGKLVRAEGQPPSKDKNVNEAYDNCLKVLQFYKEIFGYTSLDGKNMPVVSSVHYEKGYQNAGWYGVDVSKTYNQMVYGDGAGNLYNFTNCIDVIGHEITHAVTQFTSMLVYQDESGALNEHISDVFGIMVKQFEEKKTANDANWLVGEGCLMPGQDGIALRSMIQPGKAYNNIKLLGGKDPQPARYQDIEAFKTANPSRVSSDHGGVHIFSGVPNRAFVICAQKFGGYSWEKAGKIWWTTISTHRIPPRCTFLQFADATVTVAQEQFGDEAAKTVRAAWNEVGVVRTI